MLLRFFEAGGEVHKSVAVIKSRTTDHERTIREFTINGGGIRVGQPLTAFQGVLSGQPRYPLDGGGLIVNV
jgi:circadian clock protein KaiC